jgi:nucleotide-binding universal stress UspA family protein
MVWLRMENSENPSQRKETLAQGVLKYENLGGRVHQKARKAGVACAAVLLVGDAAEEILALARDMKADLIVVASLHPTLLGRLFNLNKAAMHRAPYPVLVYCEGNR